VPPATGSIDGEGTFRADGLGEEDGRRMRVDEAYELCEAITRREAKNFAYGIRLLKKPERQALSSVYALARRIDDIGDGELTPDAKLAALQQVRKDIDSVDTHPDDPVLVAVADAERRYGLPMSAFGEIIDGCEMDVIGTSYVTIEDLVGYCRRVAGSVGRLSLAVFGSNDPERALVLADSLGVALQLTNILRDVVEDKALGRVYLPSSDADTVGCPADLSGPPSAVADLVAFECVRAQIWFDEGLQLLTLLDGRSRACVSAMAGIYRRLLDRISEDPIAVTRGRLSLSGWEKVGIAARSLAGQRT
jgi:phytoene synthase